MITASLCGAKIEEFVLNSTDAAALFSKVGTGATLPVLETESGEMICQTPAILQYIAHGSDLLGKSQFEKTSFLIKNPTAKKQKGVAKSADVAPKKNQALNKNTESKLKTGSSEYEADYF